MTTEKTIYDELNERAGAILATMDEPNALDACRQAARNVGLRRVKGDGQCELWAGIDGREVNLWIEDVRGVGLAPGGLGFDDQTDHYLLPA